MSLVGEKERKLLKEIVKLAKTPVKSRIVPTGEKEIDSCCSCCYSFSCKYVAAGFVSTHSKMSLKLLTVLACLTFELKSFLNLILKCLIFSPQR